MTTVTQPKTFDMSDQAEWRSRWPRPGHEDCGLCRIVLEDSPYLAAELVDFPGQESGDGPGVVGQARDSLGGGQVPGSFKEPVPVVLDLLFQGHSRPPRLRVTVTLGGDADED